ncbi:MAG: 6-bladed beta-propeller [Gemmatimonadota bacterium]
MIRSRVFLLGLIAAAACGGIDSDPSIRPQFVRLPNGALRVRGPDDGVWGAKPWRLTEERRIGRMEGEDPDLFGQPWAVEQDELGRIYVLDQQSKDVRVFAADGKHLRTIGRPGGGPGEFSNPFGLLWDSAGNLWVVDIGHARYSARVWAGHSSEYSIALRELSGDTIMVIERAIQAVPVLNDDRAAFIAALPDEVRKHPKLDLSRIPATKPFFERLLPDPDGRLWVLRRGVGDNWQFDVFGEDGAFLGEVALPVEPTLLPPPLIKKDAILLVTRDSLDVSYIVRLRIVKP